MKKNILFTLAVSALLLAACNNSGNPTSSNSQSSSASASTSVSSEESHASDSDASNTQEGEISVSLYFKDGGATIIVGDSAWLGAKINGVDSNAVIWSSSDDAIATVNNGTINALSVGEVDITATSTEDTTKSATVHIEVIAKPKTISKLADVINLESDTTFSTHAIIAGLPAGTYEYTKNGTTIDEYKYVYVADGENFFQGYNVHASDLVGIEVGDVVEIDGKVSQHDPSSKGAWVTPEFTSMGFTKVEDSSVAAPVFIPWDATHPLGTITEGDINKGYVLTDAIVTSISTSSSNNTTINVKIGSEKATIYLHNQAKDNTVEGFDTIQPGYRISGNTFVGSNYNQDGFQFVGLNNLTITEGELPDEDPIALSEVLNLGKGNPFKTKAKVVGMPSVKETKNNVEIYKYIYVADGETFYQLYEVKAEYAEDIQVGDYIEIVGTVNDYTSNSGDKWTTKEGTVTKALVKLADHSAIAEPVLGAWDDTHPLGELTEADVNKGYQVSGATIKSVTAGNSGTTVTLELGDESIALYLRAGSYDLAALAEAGLVAGYKMSARMFMSQNNSVAQFAHFEDATFEQGELVLELQPLADVLDLAKDTAFKSRAVFLGKTPKPEGSGDSKYYTNVYVADGETFYLLYQVPVAYMENINVGDVIEFEGVVSNYKNNWTTKEARLSEAPVVVTDDSIAAPVYSVWDEEHELPTLTEADVNKGYQVNDAVITAYASNKVTLQIGEKTAELYLRADGFDQAELVEQGLKVGNKMSAKMFVGHNRGNAQFVHIEDVTFTAESHPVEDVSVEQEAVTLKIGEEHTIVASATPNLASQEFTYTIDEGGEEIVELDGAKVTAKAEGSATITVASVEDPTKTATVTITVTAEQADPKIDIDYGDEYHKAADHKWSLDNATQSDVLVSREDDVFTYNTINVYNSNGYAMLAAKNKASKTALLANATAVPGAIKSITVTTTASSSSNAKINIGLATTAFTEVVTDDTNSFVNGTKTVTAEESAGYSYFAISAVTNYNAQIKTISITYVPFSAE